MVKRDFSNRLIVVTNFAMGMTESRSVRSVNIARGSERDTMAKVKVTRTKDGREITVKQFLALKQPRGDVTVEVEGERVSLTSLERIYWPGEKLTKFDLLCYYLK